MNDLEARKILDANRVEIMEDNATPVEIVERLTELNKLALPKQIGGGAIILDTLGHGLTTDELAAGHENGTITTVG